MKKVIIVTSSILVAVVAFLCVYELYFANRLVVRNSSGVDVKDVTLSVQDLDGKWHASKSATLLKPGASLVIRHSKNDTRAELAYTINGTSRVYKQNYIDLWTGEEWLFDIQPDGSVQSGYDYPRND
jgi:hypothetical protein